MSLYKSFGFNEELGKNGNWFQPIEKDPAKFKIRFAGYDKKTRENFLRTVAVDKDQILKDVNLQLKKTEELAQILVEHLIVDWKDLKWENGKELKYSKENCKYLLENAQHLITIFADFSNNRANFIEDDTNVKKKSSSPSKASSNSQTQKST